MLHDMLKLVNHEAWIEIEDRAYLKWGHPPKTDGKLDPKSIKRAFVIDPDRSEKVIGIGNDKEATSKKALFLEFNTGKHGLYLIVVEYDRGIYSLTGGNKRVFGDEDYVVNLGYIVNESRRLYGFAKAYIIIGDYEYTNKKASLVAGLEFEIVPETIKKFRSGDKVSVGLFKNNPVKGEVNVKANGRHAVIETNSDGFAELELAKGVNAVSSRYVAKKACYESITTTLTITVERGCR